MKIRYSLLRSLCRLKALNFYIGEKILLKILAIYQHDLNIQSSEGISYFIKRNTRDILKFNKEPYEKSSVR